MKLSSLILLGTAYLSHTALATPINPDAAAPQPSAQAVRYFYNVGPDKQYELDTEKIAWDDANTLAKAASGWTPGEKYQPIVDYFMGTNCANNNDAKTEIQTALKNAVDVHNPGPWGFRARIFVYLHETGKYDPPYGSPQCGGGTVAYTFTFPGIVWNDYYIVFCDFFWELLSAQKILNLNEMEATIRDLLRHGTDETGNVSRMWYTTGHTYFHELMHIAYLVSPRPSGTDDIVYQAAAVHDLAVLKGCAPGKAIGTQSSLNNADSYAVFADSVYFSQRFGKGANDFPRDGKIPTVVSANGAVPSLKNLAPLSAYKPYLPANPNEDATPTAEATGTNGGPTPLPTSSPVTAPRPTSSAPPAPPLPSPPTCNPGTAPIFGTDPAFLNSLAAVFCDPAKTNFGADASKAITGANLSPPSVAYKDVSVQFDFKKGTGICADFSCANAYSGLIKSCQYDSHSIYGSGSVSAACGQYAFSIKKV